MPMFTSLDGRYVFAMETAGEGDGNSVVYDRGVPVWDRFSHEARTGSTPPPPPSVPPPGHPLASRVIRVTQDSDGHFAPRMMSDRANAWATNTTAFVFAGSVQTGGPQFFGVDLASARVTRLGALIPYVGETEGWYWTPDGLVTLIDGPRLHRVNPFTGGDEVVLDISADYPGHDLWQAHSSDDGQTHSATVRQIVSEGRYPYVGTVVSRHGTVTYFPAIGTLDESQVTRDGARVVFKENRGSGDDNRVIDLDTRKTQWLPDQARAMGHSDCGPDFIVGEADKPDPGMCGWWDLTKPLTPERFHPLFQTTNMGYVSARGGRLLWSGSKSLSLVAMSGAVTHLLVHGGTSDYDGRVKANLSPCGRVATYMIGTSVYLLVL